ncbi:MAG: HAD family hydrolase [Luteibaculaceae bacterium]
MKVQYKVIFWDFDGVILNSNEVRDQGFIEVLNDYPKDKVDLLLAYHQKNGGLSRYVKFRYFYEEILGEPITEEQVYALAESFSVIMKKLLTDKSLLINETVNFIRENHQRYIMHIVSGSDQNELRYLCKELGIAGYFKSIHGSPTHKNILVKDLLMEHQYKIDKCLLIGDSINDEEAAKINGIHFLGYNNPKLKAQGIYLNDFKNLPYGL